MSLQEQIQVDLTAAMKARDKAATGALRMVLAAMKNKAVEEGLGPQGALTDEQVFKLLATEVKRRKEAAEAFRQGGSEERAAGEEAEADLYEAYLPAQLADVELAAIIDDAIAEAGAEGMGDMGNVMKAAMARVAGRADGGRVSAFVKERLAG
jgi:hypothetical protein